MKAKSNIKFVPIFDQSADKIWSEFVRIEMLCDAQYGFENEANSIYESHVCEWRTQKYNFAFGAYDGVKMVGFANGYRDGTNGMYLHNLYVDPKYQGMKIGTQLLLQSERAATLYSDKMTLMALKESVAAFYEKYGYHTHNRRYMMKTLPEQVLGVVPVFQPKAKLKVKIETVFPDIVLEKCKNRPLFIYQAPKGEISGIALKMVDGDDKIWVNQSKRGMCDFYEQQLLRALSKVK